jgi:uncharacterized RDD family membrane protein YckC
LHGGRVADNFNPYKAPEANLETVEPPREMVRADKGRRFATYLIDYLGIYATVFVFAFLITLVFGQAGLRAMLAINEIVLSVIFFFLYYVFFEGIWARTPAKLILGTVVVTLEGSKPGLRTILLRTLCRFIPFEPFSFLGERGWHDGLSDTLVVSTRG